MARSYVIIGILLVLTSSAWTLLVWDWTRPSTSPAAEQVVTERVACRDAIAVAQFVRDGGPWKRELEYALLDFVLDSCNLGDKLDEARDAYPPD